MIPESRAIQRPPKARLLALDAEGQLRHIRRADFVTLLRSWDLVIANDAATCQQACAASTSQAAAP
jgi:hypothetical protein